MDEVFNRTWELLHLLQDQGSKLLLVYARARLESITLEPIDLDSCVAVTIASVNRLDWMNARANLVDTWRLIEFNADNLESDLDIIVDGNLRRSEGNETGQLRVGFEFDAPLARLGERNQYRQSLIEYQQARRNYLAFVDGVSQSLRGTLRTMELNQVNFEIRRQAVWSAIDQADQARLRLYEEPPAAGASTTGTDTLGPTAARDLLSALSDLLSSQNDFLSVWVNFQLQRVQLDLDLGTMQLDYRGMWIDPGTIGAGYVGGVGADCAPEVELMETIPPGMEVEREGGADPALGPELVPPDASDETLLFDPTKSEDELPIDVPDDAPAAQDGTPAQPLDEEASPHLLPTPDGADRLPVHGPVIVGPATGLPPTTSDAGPVRVRLVVGAEDGSRPAPSPVDPGWRIRR
jgi:hypothetical protein